MGDESYTLYLNRTHLLFVPLLNHPGCPPRQDFMGTVVQVSLRAVGCTEGSSDQEERVYAIEQATIITRTIETLVAGHVNAVYKLPERVVIPEIVSGYTLVGVKKPWMYGRGKQFFLGDVPLQPAEDKWIFHFEVAK